MSNCDFYIEELEYISTKDSLIYMLLKMYEDAEIGCIEEYSIHLTEDREKLSELIEAIKNKVKNIND